MNPTATYTAVAADGTRIALHRLRPSVSIPAPPVLLVPGSFSTRTFWIGTRGEGFAQFLSLLGFDTWIAEMRGHGASDRPRSWTMHDWIRKDAPAAIRQVLLETGASTCYWVGHSAGGVVGAGVLGNTPEIAGQIQGIVLLGSPGPAGLGGFRRFGARAAYIGTGLAPWIAVSGSLLGLGPEHEPAPMIREWMHWNLAGLWRTPEGGDYLSGLKEVDVPLLAVSGAGDRLLAPPATVRDLADRFGSADRTVVVAGLREGFHADYGHADLMVSRSARSEIWTLVAEWLRARAAGDSPNVRLDTR